MFYRTRFENEIASLLEYEDSPPPEPYYLAIDLNAAALKGKKVGAYVPTAAAAAKIVDIIVFFHGVVSVCGSETDFRAKGIEYLWSHPPFDKLRSELEASGRAALLIAPRLDSEIGKSWNTNHFGNLHKDKAFDSFIGKCREKLVGHNAIRPDVKFGNIVLAAHSGGGWPMNEILKAKNDLKPKIRALWGFECIYPAFTPKTWSNWLDSDATLRFRHFREKSSLREVMKDEARALGKAKHKNFFDTTTGTKMAHCGLLREFWNTAIGHMPKTAGAKESF